MGEANRKRTIEERKADEKKREDEAFKLFEKYVLTIVLASQQSADYFQKELETIREKFREFIKTGA